MSLNIFWEFCNVDEKTIAFNLETLRTSQLTHNIYVPAPQYAMFKSLLFKSSIKPLKDGDFYEFLKHHIDNSALRLRTDRFKLAPNILDKMYELHKNNNCLFTYCDGYDLCLNICFEIVEPKVIDILNGERLYYPDNNLALFDFVKSTTYLMDFDDQSFYYQNCFDDYYSYPKGINIEPTLRCNLKCTMCCYQSESYSTAWKKAELPDFMSFDLYKKIIDEISTYPQKPSIELCYRGEPLLNKNFVKMVEYASQKGIFSAVVTNSTVLKPELTDKILDAGLGAIYFSIDGGTKETYEAIRVGADYDKMVANVNYFLKKNEQKRNILTFIRFVVTEENKHESDLLVSKWIDKVDYIVVQGQARPGNEMHKNWYNLYAEESLNNAQFPCHLLWNNLTITTAGSVANCTTMYYEKKEDIIGNVNNASILEIWRSDELNERRKNSLTQNFELVPLCKDCDRVTCSALTLRKEIKNNKIFVSHHGVMQINSRLSNRKLYPSFRTESNTGFHSIPARIQSNVFSAWISRWMPNAMYQVLKKIKRRIHK